MNAEDLGLDVAGELVMLRTALGVSNSHRRGSLNRMLDLKGELVTSPPILSSSRICEAVNL